MSPDLSRAVWRKSTASANNGGCVEVADLDQHVAVRDSKSPDASALVFAGEEWDAFLVSIEGHELMRQNHAPCPHPTDKATTAVLHGAVWRRSNGTNIEIATDGDHVALREVNPTLDAAVLVFTAFEWDCFVDGVEKQEFRRPPSS